MQAQESNGTSAWRDRRFHEPGDTDPRDDECKVLGPRWFVDLPSSGCVAFGLRLAYSPDPSADKSVLVEGWLHDGKIYIVDVRSWRGNLDKAIPVLVEKQRWRPRAKIRWYASTTEIHMGKLLHRWVKRLKCLPAKGSSLTRATGASLAWNAGSILLPDPNVIEAPWLQSFIDGVVHEGKEELDALVALHDELVSGPGLLASIAPPRRSWLGRIVDAVRGWLPAP